MAAILPSLWKLSEKLGVTERADTIEAQINLLNESIDAAQGNNIADALDSYAEAQENT